MAACQVSPRDDAGSAMRVRVTATNGVGSSLPADSAPTPAGGTGLAGLADRIAALDGDLVVTSVRGQGTTLHAMVPLVQAA